MHLIRLYDIHLVFLWSIFNNQKIFHFLLTQDLYVLLYFSWYFIELTFKHHCILFMSLFLLRVVYFIFYSSKLYIASLIMRLFPYNLIDLKRKFPLWSLVLISFYREQFYNSIKILLFFKGFYICNLSKINGIYNFKNFWTINLFFLSCLNTAFLSIMLKILNFRCNLPHLSHQP